MQGISLPLHNQKECEKMKTERNFEKFTDEELARAIELMVPPQELKSRSVMIAILRAAEYSAHEARNQILEGKPLFDGPSVSWAF